MKPTLGHSHETSQNPEMEFPSREGNHPLLIALALLIAAACITLAVYELSKIILLPVPEHPRRPLRRFTISCRRANGGEAIR